MSETGTRRRKTRRPKGAGDGRRAPAPPPRMPGALPEKRPRTAADKRDTYRSVLLIGLAAHLAGIVGSLLALGLAFRVPGNELPIGESDLAFPVVFILVILAMYVCFVILHAVTLWFVRQSRPRPALTIMSIGGLVLAIGVFFSGFLLFGERFILLGAAAAYAVPYFLAPLLVGVPTTAAAAALSIRQIRSVVRTEKKQSRKGEAAPRLLR